MNDLAHQLISFVAQSTVLAIIGYFLKRHIDKGDESVKSVAQQVKEVASAVDTYKTTIVKVEERLSAGVERLLGHDSRIKGLEDRERSRMEHEIERSREAFREDPTNPGIRRKR